MKWASLVAQRVKRLPAVQETRVRSLGWEDPLEKAMAPHSSTRAWKIPWTEEPGRLQSMGSQRVGHVWATSLHSPLSSSPVHHAYSDPTSLVCDWCFIASEYLSWNLLKKIDKQVRKCSLRGKLKVTQLCLTLCDPMNKNTGEGDIFLLQGIFPTQELNPGPRIAGRFFTSWATRETLLRGKRTINTEE